MIVDKNISRRHWPLSNNMQMALIKQVTEITNVESQVPQLYLKTDRRNSGVNLFEISLIDGVFQRLMLNVRANPIIMIAAHLYLRIVCVVGI